MHLLPVASGHLSSPRSPPGGGWAPPAASSPSWAAAGGETIPPCHSLRLAQGQDPNNRHRERSPLTLLFVTEQRTQQIRNALPCSCQEMQWLVNRCQFCHLWGFDNSTEAVLPGTVAPISILFQFIVKIQAFFASTLLCNFNLSLVLQVIKHLIKLKPQNSGGLKQGPIQFKLLFLVNIRPGMSAEAPSHSSG